MKRILSIVLSVMVILSVSAACFADIDLSGMTFEELVALKDQINLAIWNSAEWQEVEVPQGVWKVGEDIPAGKWTIKATEGNVTFVMVGSKLSSDGRSISMPKFGQSIMDEGFSAYNPKTSISELSVELSDGEYVAIQESVAVFTPYAGKPSLGFK